MPVRVRCMGHHYSFATDMNTPPFTPLSPISAFPHPGHIPFWLINPASPEPIASQPKQDTQPKPASSKPRTIVLCFDGKGNKFGENSNVVRFFRALAKDRRKEQIVYFQPGLGTYDKRRPSIIAHTVSLISSKIDTIIGSHLDTRVKEGYKFIVQTYHPGDKICLFGFSDGALTARALAGMIYKVGILQKINPQHVDLAFDAFATTGYQGYKVSREFKETFCIPNTPSVDFIGAWDTVASAGTIPNTHPYTAVNYAVKTFRHALALDEHRAGLLPGTWNEKTLENEQEFDVDIPVPHHHVHTVRDDWEYEPPNRNNTDVKEVWFSGSHAEVGGGIHDSQSKEILSSIPLNWMIKESILANTGIQFDMDYLKESLDFDFQDLLEEVIERELNQDLGETYTRILEYASISPVQSSLAMSIEISFAQAQSKNVGYNNKRHGIYGNALFQLILAIVWWWIFQIIPMLHAHQDSQGNWIRRRAHGFETGRYIPFHSNEIQVHESVRERIERTKDTEIPYTPNALNWDHVSKSPMLKYVK